MIPSPPPLTPHHPHTHQLTNTLTRYNEFHDLHEKIKKQFPEANLKLPGKRFLGNNFDPEFIRARREGLHDFVMNLVKVGGTQGRLQHQDWQCNCQHYLIFIGQTDLIC